MLFFRMRDVFLQTERTTRNQNKSITVNIYESS